MQLHPLHSIKFVASSLGGGGGGGGGPITIRDSNSNNNSGDKQWIDVNLPATVEDGDHLFAYVVGARGGLTYTFSPTGWTNLGVIDNGSVNSMTSILLHKIADGSEGGGTVRISTMTFSTRLLGISVSVSGGTYVSTDTENGLDDPGNTFTVGSQSYTQDGTFLAFVSTTDDGDGGTMPPSTAPSGWSLLQRRESGGSSSTLVGGKLVYQNVTGSGSTGDISFQTESLDGGDVDFYTSHIVKLHQ